MPQDEVVSESPPRVVSAAYWIWVLCAAVMVLVGLVALTTSSAAIQARVDSDADSFVWLLRAVGGVTVLFGLGIGFLAAPVRAGNVRVRAVEVVLSSAFALSAIALAVTGIIAPVFLVLPLLLVVADVLVFREGARDWFRRERAE